MEQLAKDDRSLLVPTDKHKVGWKQVSDDPEDLDFRCMLTNTYWRVTFVLERS